MYRFEVATPMEYLGKVIDFIEMMFISAGQSIGHGVGFTIGIYFVVRSILWFNSKRK